MKFKKYKAGKGGWSEWVYPTKKYLFKCCDCGLIHEMEFASLIKTNKKGIHFNVVKLPEEISVMFRARRYNKKHLKVMGNCGYMFIYKVAEIEM